MFANLQIQNTDLTKSNYVIQFELDLYGLSSVPIKMSHSFFAAGSAVNLLFHPQNPALFPGFGFLSGIFYEYYSFLKIFISSHF